MNYRNPSPAAQYRLAITSFCCGLVPTSSCWSRPMRRCRHSTSRAAIIDISHRDAAIEVSGPRAAWVINAFCALDLHLAAFPVGMCTRTVFGKAEILLWRTGAEEFRIDVARSFAPYVWACLEEARREFLDGDGRRDRLAGQQSHGGNHGLQGQGRADHRRRQWHRPSYGAGICPQRCEGRRGGP